MKYDPRVFVVDHDLSIREALVRIDAHHKGFALVENNDGVIVGVVTDGDVRRALVAGSSLSDPIFSIANPEFVWVTRKTSREDILKKLDSEIRFLPVLDEERKLRYVIFRDFIPLEQEGEFYVCSRAPVRISFGGGGSDVTHFFSGHSGAVINTTISLYANATMRKRDDAKIIISSLDLDACFEADSLFDAINNPGNFRLVVSLLEVVQPDFGFDLFLDSDFPVGSGLGGSAAVTAAIIGCFNMFRSDQWSKHEISEIAFQAERLNLGISGGWQDQYASVFGGFNFLEFKSEQNIILPMRVSDDIILELEERLVLCDTGISHESGNIHDDQKENMKSPHVGELVKRNVELTYDIRNHLLRGRIQEFAHGLDTAWSLKRQFGNLITSSELDEIYTEAIAHGAMGGKLLGAGGGGFFVFVSAPFRKHSLIKHLKSKGLSVKPFKFEDKGLQSWAVRGREDSFTEGRLL